MCCVRVGVVHHATRRLSVVSYRDGSVKLRQYGTRRVSGKVGGKVLCKISTAAGAMPLPVVDPWASHG